MTTSKPVSAPADALEIVFEHRNKSYGAYRLRREYNVNLGKALGISLLAIAAMLVVPLLVRGFNSNSAGREVVAVLENAPKMEKTEKVIPPPEMKTPPPSQASQKFVPPTPVDNTVDTPDDTPDVDKLLNTNKPVGTTNVEGPTDAPPTLDPDPELGKIVETPVKAPDPTYESYDVQKPPAFPGGDGELLRYLAKNINYPALAKESNIQGSVVLSFVVNKNGTVEDIAILKDIGGGCGKEAVRVLQEMPRWLPGEANGHAVKVRFTLPVRFRLD